MSERKHLYDNEKTCGQLAYLREHSPQCDQIVDLYRVEGIASTYTFPHEVNGKIQCWGKVHLHWWPSRYMPLRINYEKVFGGTEYTVDEMCAVNQLWILDEAEIYKRWIDDIYPEEETKIIKMEFPLKGLESYPTDWNTETMEGSLWSAHPFWHYSWQVCYYIDTTNNKKLN